MGNKVAVKGNLAITCGKHKNPYMAESLESMRTQRGEESRGAGVKKRAVC